MLTRFFLLLFLLIIAVYRITHTLRIAYLRPTNHTFHTSLLSTAEDSLNISLREITVTARDGRVSQLEQVYIRGSMVRAVPLRLCREGDGTSYGGDLRADCGLQEWGLK
jgi:hypothetical protein